MNVYLTIDTEVYPITPGWKKARLQFDIQRDIFGRVGAAEVGLRFQLGELLKYSLKAVFMVEALFASCQHVGLDPLREIVDLILQDGHEVGLHIHPEWIPHIPELAEKIPHVELLKDLDQDSQFRLIEMGQANLARCGVTKVHSFRSGDYAANLDTLRALARAGIGVDTSYNFSYLGKTCSISTVHPLLQPYRIEGVLEYPIGVFEDWPNHYRHLQLCAVSSRELQGFLQRALAFGWHSAVLVSHSFELLKNRRSKRKSVAVRERVKSRLDTLLRFLAENRATFHTSLFSDVDAGLSRVQTTPHSQHVKGHVYNTVFRMYEQLTDRMVGDH
jgi:hypothetical protein